MDVINYLEVSEHISTSGQPSAEDFATIAKIGYQTVINLALSSSDNAIVHEGDIVTRLGMTYLHIPVQFDRPQTAQFELFAHALQQQAEDRVWVHCALNMRVSAFMYLYNTLYRKLPEADAQQLLQQVWQPNPVWAEFIGTVQQNHKDPVSQSE